MDQLPLAAFDTHDWINLAVILIIFGGSTIGGFLKWLAAQFSDEEQKPEKPQHRAPPTEANVRPRAATPRPPAARPMPQRPTTRKRPPVATRLPSQPVARASERGRAPMAVPPPRKPTQAKPIRRPRPVPGSTGSARRALPPDQPLTPRPSQRRAQPPKRVSIAQSPGSAPKPSMAAPASSIKERGDRLGRLDPELGHLDPDADLGHIQKEGHVGHLQQKAPKTRRPKHTARTDGEAVVDELGCLRHPTRRALRRAVIMNEILGPPLGLRPIDEIGYS